MKISNTVVLIIAHNEKENLQKCIEAIRQQQTDEELAVLVIDNASDDGTAEWLSTQEDIAYGIEEQYVESWSQIVNEAIESFEISGDILFLQPGCQVAQLCIKQMKQVLYHQENIAAVGPLIDGDNYNCHSYSQPGESGEPARKQVMGLREEAVMVRYEAIRSIGKLDAGYKVFASGIMDYLLRAVKEGWKLYCVTSALVVNAKKQESVEEIILKNIDLDYMYSKWGMKYWNRECNTALLDLMTQKQNEELAVLEIGCDCGATLLELKNRFPNAQAYGYEINESAVSIAEKVADVQVGNIEEKLLPYEKGKFDYIFFGDVLEHLHNPDETIEYCREFLKEDGCIIACIPNLMHISVMKNLLEGDFTYREIGLLDKTHIHLFTFNEIVRMFQSKAYEIEDVRLKEMALSAEDEEAVDKIMSITSNSERFMFTTFQYVVRARKPAITKVP